LIESVGLKVYEEKPDFGTQMEELLSRDQEDEQFLRRLLPVSCGGFADLRRKIIVRRVEWDRVEVVPMSVSSEWKSVPLEQQENGTAPGDLYTDMSQADSVIRKVHRFGASFRIPHSHLVSHSHRNSTRIAFPARSGTIG
jgi:hypothetical protein